MEALKSLCIFFKGMTGNGKALSIVLDFIIMAMKTIVKGRVFDGEKVIEKGAVVFDNDTGIIDAVGEQGEVEEPKDADVVDAANHTITPGFIDVHMHFFGSKTLDLPEWNVTPEATVAIRSVVDMWNLLSAGFTTVRDLGSKVGTYLSKAERAGEIKGPRVIAAAKSLAQTGGNDDYKLLPIHMAHELSYSYYCDSPWECRKAVRLCMRDGAEAIKVYASGTMSQSGQWKPHLTVEELRAIADEAHRAYVKVTAHAYGEQALKNVVEAGIDSIEHGLELTEETAKLIKKAGIYYIPTLSVYSIHKAEAGSAREKIVARHLDEEMVIARNNGLSIAAGTDFVGAVASPHGQNYMEMKLLSKHFGNLEALKAGTSGAAECLGLPNVGRLKKGNVADLVVLKGNPLEDIEATSPEHVVHVFHDGKKFK